MVILQSIVITPAGVCCGIVSIEMENYDHAIPLISCIPAHICFYVYYSICTSWIYNLIKGIGAVSKYSYNVMSILVFIVVNLYCME